MHPVHMLDAGDGRAYPDGKGKYRVSRRRMAPRNYQADSQKHNKQHTGTPH